MSSCGIMYLQLKLNTMKEKKLDISPFLYIAIMIVVFTLAL